MIIFRCNDHKTVGADYCIPPLWKQIADLRSVIVVRQLEIANIEQERFDVIALAHFAAYPIGDVSTLAVLPRRS